MSHFLHDRMTGQRDETDVKDIAETRPFGQTRFHCVPKPEDYEAEHEHLDRIAEPGEGSGDRCETFNRQLRETPGRAR